MNILFALGHPAHYHLFKNVSTNLRERGHQVHFAVTPKDVLLRLLLSNNEKHSILAKRKINETIWDKIYKLLKSTRSLNRIVKSRKIDLIVGCISQIAFSSKILGIPSIFVGEDDFSYTWVQGLITYPFVNCILAPRPTKVGPFEFKRISYDGYQKLSYLHPKYFKFSRITTKRKTKKKVLIRLVDLSAYHDIVAKGLNNDILIKFIDKFKNKVEISISSERELPEKFEKYRTQIEPCKMHEFLLNTDLFIGDSQSMAVEASLLGVPNVRINNFARKISIINELEFKYKLTISLHPKESYKLLDISNKILSDSESTSECSIHKTEMIRDKINVTDFFVWFFENYPVSQRIMKINPDYQHNFK